MPPWGAAREGVPGSALGGSRADRIRAEPVAGRALPAAALPSRGRCFRSRRNRRVGSRRLRSRLRVALQLSDESSSAEQIYKHALSLATPQQAHSILSNLGNLFRQQRRFECAKMMFAKSLEICPGYAPAHNNLGLVYAAEDRWQDAINCFDKALQSDPLLDAAKSNMVKGVSIMLQERQKQDF
ncbi:hypothetical protein KSP40_PGU022523 [Platanthera guangdongensis]|uniref:Tetratricopeptide repeat protein n=1 Tax=Platanthera guangdongensis TaxID=2320717 RepID=A0ABR2MLR8_9ASPA